MSFTVKTLLVLVGSLGAVGLLIYGYVTYWFATKQIWRELAQDVLISSDWLEISPRPNLKARHHVQYVYLAIEGYDPDRFAPLGPITLPDGTELNPEVQVLDDYGQVYSLKGLSRIGSLVGFGASFPQERFYTAVRIRGDKSFRCSKVYWECSRLK